MLCNTAPQTFKNGDILEFGNLSFSVLLTPGHTRGSVCYFAGDAVFTGDTFFADGYGRTDLYGGNGRQELRSLAKIGELEGDYKVYPGHEADTTLDYERENNRYMRTRFRRK